MSKRKITFMCQECGYESPKWMGKCPACHQWNTLVEELESSKGSKQAFNRGIGNRSKPEKINTIVSEKEPRITTTMQEFNRVLGGGIVPGSLILIGGDPGIGKSTLLLQISNQLAEKDLSVLYISGVESTRQSKLRGDRLGVKGDSLYVLAETNLADITNQNEQIKLAFVVVDSIQTVFCEEVTSAPVSVSKARAFISELIRIAKIYGIPIVIVGHVTKEGSIAGPRLLEHMVDAVLYFEGERHHTYRMLRGIKNRFGSTNEMGVFEMKESGLREVLNPSEIFLEERSQGAAGSTVVASMEGTRPVLVEIQALISPTSFGNPRRMATGI